MMTTTMIEELKRLEAEATPGPWSTQGKYISAIGGTDTYSGAVHGTIICCEETCQSDFEGRTWSTGGDALSNAALIVDMRNALPELLKALEWQPIETAPRDEPVLLAWFDTFFERWDYDTNFAFIGEVKHGLATHWMPLPLPPHGGVDVG